MNFSRAANLIAYLSLVYGSGEKRFRPSSDSESVERDAKRVRLYSPEPEGGPMMAPADQALLIYQDVGLKGLLREMPTMSADDRLHVVESLCYEHDLEDLEAVGQLSCFSLQELGYDPIYAAKMYQALVNLLAVDVRMLPPDQSAGLDFVVDNCQGHLEGRLDLHLRIRSHFAEDENGFLKEGGPSCNLLQLMLEMAEEGEIEVIEALLTFPLFKDPIVKRYLMVQSIVRNLEELFGALMRSHASISREHYALAAFFDRSRMLRALFSEDAPAIAPIGVLAAVNWACALNHTDSLTAILGSPRCPPFLHGPFMATMAAIQNGHLGVLRVLQEHHLTTSPKACRYLACAANHGNAQMVAYLMEDWKISPLGPAGYDAVALAVRQGHLEVLRLLLTHPDVNPNDTVVYCAIDGEGKGMEMYRMHLDHPRYTIQRDSLEAAAVIAGIASVPTAASLGMMQDLVGDVKGPSAHVSAPMRASLADACMHVDNAPVLALLMEAGMVRIGDLDDVWSIDGLHREIAMEAGNVGAKAVSLETLGVTHFMAGLHLSCAKGFLASLNVILGRLEMPPTPTVIKEALRIASYFGHFSVVQRLLSLPGATHDDVLIGAALSGKDAIVKEMLHRGASHAHRLPFYGALVPLADLTEDLGHEKTAQLLRLWPVFCFSRANLDSLGLLADILGPIAKVSINSRTSL